MKTDDDKLIIGSNELIEVAGIKDVPAKIDTGADTSSIWASDIDMSEDGILSFTLFSPKSPLYTGERISTNDYRIKVVRSSHGDEQIRYRVRLMISLGGREFETTFTLANRLRNHFPVLIGRHTLENNYLVDVSRSSLPRHSNNKTLALNQELREDPFSFHQKYLKRKG